MPSFLLGWQGYVAAAVMGALLAAGGTFYVTSLGYRLTISKMETATASADLKNAQATLDGFVKNADRIAGAADAFQGVKASLDSRFATINRTLADALRQNPLPLDCRPDPDRMQSLSAAIAAANSATGPQPRPAVPPAH
jgi:hypothetical protein